MGESVTIKHKQQLQLIPDLEFEIHLWEAGFKIIGGLDEAGRGAWAGPVGAAVVVLPADKKIMKTLSGVRDSKKMTPRQRDIWAERIREEAVMWGVGFADHLEIDAYGIVPATKMAMKRAIEGINTIPDYLLIDAVKLTEMSIPQSILIRGDSRSLSIAAASILAKTGRDRIMIEMDTTYPEYGFARHKGYGTAFHRKALDKLGPTVIHRKSYAPIKRLLEG